jgi:ABC-2 type transport system permease protein
VKALSQTLALARMMALQSFRDVFVYVALAVFPAAFFITFSVIGGSGLSRHVLYGFLVAMAMNPGVVSLPQQIVYYKHVRKLQDIFVASPATPFIYLAGLSLAQLMYSVPGLIGIAVILAVMGGLQLAALPVTLAILLLTWVTGSTLGFMVGSVVPKANVVSGLANMLGFFLVLFPPVMYPLDMVPGAWKWIAMLAPTVDAAHLVRVANGVGEASPLMIAVQVAILVLYAAVGAVVVSRKSHWRDP